MKPLSDAAFDALVREARGVGAWPFDWALVLYEESNWDSHRRNASGAHYYGLNQMGEAELRAFGLTPEAWLASEAEQQIPYIARFWQQKRRAYGPLIYASAAHLLAYNFLPARVKHSADAGEIDYALTSAGDVDYRDKATGQPHSFYEANRVYDPAPSHGFISIRDLGSYLARLARNNPRDMATLRAGIDAASARAGIDPLTPPVDPLVATIPEVVITGDPEASRGGSGKMGPLLLFGLVLLGALVMGRKGGA